MVDDTELLRRYAEEKSEAAFAELVARHLDLVYAAALRRLGGDAHAAADVAQQVFVATARQAGALARGVVLPAWLYAMTRNASVDWIRAERRRRAREQEAHIMENSSSNPEPGATADWARLRPMLDAAMDELGERDREAVVLRFFARRPFAEIGRALNVKEDAARMRVDRALEKLQALLARRGVTSTGAALGVLLAGEAAHAAPAGLALSVTGAAVTAAGATAAAAGPVAGLIHFMSTSKIAAGVVALGLIGVGGTTAYEVRSGRQERAALLTERRALFALVQRTENVERQAKAAAGGSGAGQRAATGTAEKAPTVEKEVNGPFGPEPPGSRARGRAIMAAYPEIQRLIAEDRRAFFADYYRKLYDELALTPAQIEAFELVKIAGVSHTIGGTPESETVTFDAAPVLSREEKDRRLREILGERGYRRLEEFDDSPRDNRVAQLAGRLYFTETPLTAEQGERLLGVLMAANKASGGDQPPAEYWAGVRAQAAGFLSPPQLTALAGLQVSDEYHFAQAENQRLRSRSAADGAK